jgi:hypothetical protein
LKFAIEEKIRELFKANSLLDKVKLFFIGEPIFIQLQHYPTVIIMVERQVPTDEETNTWVYRYQGYVAAETALMDDYVVENREADVESLLLIRQILDDASKTLEANLNLGSLVSDDEKVRAISLGEKIYTLTNRQNNYLNRGDFNFLVETQRPRS